MCMIRPGSWWFTSRRQSESVATQVTATDKALHDNPPHVARASDTHDMLAGGFRRVARDALGAGTHEISRHSIFPPVSVKT